MAFTFHVLLNQESLNFWYCWIHYWKVFSLIHLWSENLFHEIWRKEIRDSLMQSTQCSSCTNVPPAAMVWGTDIRVQFQVFFVFFPQVLHGVRQCSLTAERHYAITTMFFAKSGNATEYTEAHQHKRHLLSTRKTPAFRKLNKWNISLSLNLI